MLAHTHTHGSSEAPSWTTCWTWIPSSVLQPVRKTPLRRGSHVWGFGFDQGLVRDHASPIDQHSPVSTGVYVNTDRPLCAYLGLSAVTAPITVHSVNGGKA